MTCQLTVGPNSTALPCSYSINLHSEGLLLTVVSLLYRALIREWKVCRYVLYIVPQTETE